MATRTVAAELGLPRRWHQDPVVWLGVAVAVASSAYVFFAGRYLPYQDWAGHVGLSSVLGIGDETGADRYLTRSWLPTPYLLFYLSTAGWATLGLAEVGAKVNLLLAVALMVIGGARLAEATGRDPRLALLTPLSMFGVSLGLGFSSYLFAIPWLFFVLADLEWLLRSLRLDDEVHERESRVRSTFLAVGITLCFLGHGLVFVFTTLLVGLRLAVHLAPRLRSDTRGAARAAASVALAFVPTLLIASPSIFRRLDHPYVAPEFALSDPPAFVDLATHAASFGADLLDRGGDGHAITAALAIAVFLIWVAFSRRDRGPRTQLSSVGIFVYLAAAIALFTLGPARATWPVTFWVVYQRAGSLALAFLVLTPTCDLSGRRGAALAALAFAPVLHNASVDAAPVRAFSEWAAPFDEVRAAVPKGQRVLPIISPRSLGPSPNAGFSLGFYLLADGAAYVPIAHVPEEMPVHRIEQAKRPKTYDARNYRPAAAAREYDYVVIRGPDLVRRTRESLDFDEALESGGWVVFRSKAPPP